MLRRWWDVRAFAADGSAGGAAGAGAAGAGAAGAGAAGAGAAGAGAGASGADAGAASAGAGASGAGAGAAGAEGQGTGSLARDAQGQKKADEQGQGQGEKKADPTAPTPFHPDGLPDAYKGANDRETIERLWKDLGTAPKPPANATDYKLELPKDLVGVIDPANDKVLPIFQQVAHGLKLSPEQYQGAIVGLYQGMAKAGMIGKAVDVSGEYATLGEGAPDRAAQIEKGRERASAVADTIDAMVTREVIGKDLGEALVGSLVSAKHVVAMERLLAMIPGEHGVQPRGRPSSGAKSRAEVESMMQDPRYDARGQKFSQAYFDEVNRLFEQVAG